MLHNPYKVVKLFEEEIQQYTGAPYAVAVDSCTSALLLCCLRHKVQKVEIPRKTYLSVPQSIMHAGGQICFANEEWQGIYQLKPYQIIDAAKRFTKDMYQPGFDMCLSFQAKKILKIGKGGMILTDNPESAQWYKNMRYEGRTDGKFYKEDNIKLLGYNFYMTPVEAATGLMLMQVLPDHNKDQDEDTGNGYRDLLEFDLFKDCEIE